MLCLSTTFAPDNTPLEDALNACRSIGISSVELGSNHPYHHDVESIIQRYNFVYLTHNYFPPPPKPFVVNIASSKKDIRQASLAHIKRAITFCQKINAKLYTFHPGFLTDPHGSNRTDQNYDFQWDNTRLDQSEYQTAYESMVDSISEIVTHAANCGVRVAIETEGSYVQRDHLLMQHPQEFSTFFESFTPNDIGINLNIGHLHLALRSFGFQPHDFIKLIKPYVVAMELSHNNGMADQHLPLRPNQWYWKIINGFPSIYKIMEYRNTPIHNILRSIQIYNQHTNTNRCLNS